MHNDEKFIKFIWGNSKIDAHELVDASTGVISTKKQGFCPQHVIINPG